MKVKRSPVFLLALLVALALFAAASTTFAARVARRVIVITLPDPEPAPVVISP